MTTTTDADLLLREVCRNPADDTARLVYADAIEEQGEGERAAYIRTAIDRHETTNFEKHRRKAWMYGHSLPPWDDWPDSAHTLFRVVCGDGYQSPCSFDTRSLDFLWSRGFIARVTLPLAEFLTPTGRVRASVRRLFRCHPVTEVGITDLTPWEGRSHWVWWQDHGHDAVPLCLFKLMWDAAADEIHSRMGWDMLKYPTRDLALATLSRAAVTLARTAVGLPALEVTP